MLARHFFAFWTFAFIHSIVRQETKTHPTLVPSSLWGCCTYVNVYFCMHVCLCACPIACSRRCLRRRVNVMFVCACTFHSAKPSAGGFDWTYVRVCVCALGYFMRRGFILRFVFFVALCVQFHLILLLQYVVLVLLYSGPMWCLLLLLMMVVVGIICVSGMSVRVVFSFPSFGWWWWGWWRWRLCRPDNFTLRFPYKIVVALSNRR